MDRIKEALEPSIFAKLTAEEVAIWRTPEGTLFVDGKLLILLVPHVNAY